MQFLPWTHPSKSMQVNQPLAPRESFEQYTAYSLLLDRNGQWIGVADTKANVVLGFLVATVPLFAAPALSKGLQVIQMLLHDTSLQMSLVSLSFLTLVLFFLVTAFLTLWYVFLTLFPQLERGKKTQKQGKQVQKGLIFFSDIARQDVSQWQQQFLCLDAQTLSLQVLEQVYVTACIAHRKHTNVRRAMRSMLMTVLLGMILFLLEFLLH